MYPQSHLRSIPTITAVALLGVLTTTGIAQIDDPNVLLAADWDSVTLVASFHWKPWLIFKCCHFATQGSPIYLLSEI